LEGRTLVRKFGKLESLESCKVGKVKSQSAKVTRLRSTSSARQENPTQNSKANRPATLLNPNPVFSLNNAG